jgi:hypothetical protein
MNSLARYSVRTNGPLPTAGTWSLRYSPMSATFDHTCSGTIGTSSASMVACGCLVRITTVRSSAAVTDSKSAVKLPLAVAASSSRIMRS